MPRPQAQLSAKTDIEMGSDSPRQLVPHLRVSYLQVHNHRSNQNPAVCQLTICLLQHPLISRLGAGPALQATISLTSFSRSTIVWSIRCLPSTINKKSGT